MNFTEEHILLQLERIITNKSFSRSKINVRLLQFLVKSTLEGKDVKETTIGIEFFGNKYDPIKLDNRVRVYIYHLRKKLDEYYQTSNLSDEIIFKITKGQYKVQFKEKEVESSKKKLSTKWVYFLGLFLILIFSLLLMYQKPVNSFWGDLMKNELSTTVIFGDYFTIEGPISTGKEGIIRDYEINSEEELKNFINKNPNKSELLKASRHHYFNWMAPYCSKVITAYWSDYEYPFDITQVSEWSVDNLEKQNLVYFGQSKTMGVLKNILLESFPNYNFRSQVLERTDPETKKITIYKDVITYKDKITDYTIVSKISLPKGNEIRFFLSDQDCGAISAIKFFTDDASVRTFYKEHNITKNDDFIALFKVTGWLRKSYDMEFLVLDKN